MKKHITLLSLCSLLLAGCSSNTTSAVSTSSPSSSTPSTLEDETADVVIVGGGIAGLSAALEFQKDYPNLDVILLEENNFLGGSALYSEGLVLGYSDENGNYASTDEFKTLFHKSSEVIEEYGFVKPGYTPNDALIENVFKNVSDNLNYLNEIGSNIHYEDLPYYNENSYDDAILCYAAEGSGSGLIQSMTSYLEGKEIDIRTNSKVTSLLHDENRVTGVSVETSSGTYSITSNYVILATGGMANNQDALVEYNSNFANVYFETNPGANGDGITFTRDFNTPLIGDGVLGLISSDDDLYQLMQCHFMVDKDGNRFTNESLNTYLLLNALQNLADGEAYVIADENYYNEAKEEVDYKLEAGTVTKYDTLEEVASATGIHSENLLNTIQTYNESVHNGKNPEFDLDVTLAHSVEEGPYYVEKASTYCFGTLRGLETNDTLNVLNGEKDTVEGLYAIGELAVGNIFSGQYSKSGAMLSYGINSGFLVASTIGEALTK